jgi:hypothetical protein
MLVAQVFRIDRAMPPDIAEPLDEDRGPEAAAARTRGLIDTRTVGTTCGLCEGAVINKPLLDSGRGDSESRRNRRP